MARNRTSGTTASSPQSESSRQETQDGWIPLGRAIFRFGISDAGASGAGDAPNAVSDLFSVEAFLESRGSERVSKVGEPTPPTLAYLTGLLRKQADASRAEIDIEEGTFLFSFTLSGGGAASYSGPPWAILHEPDETLKLDPRLEAEALFNNDGPVRISDDSAAEGARQSEGIRFATGLVWRRLMLPAFDHAVKVGRVKLYARWPSTSDHFQRLPSDIWPQLEIMNWEHGVARDVMGTLYRSIHVADTAAPIDKSGGQSFEAADARLVEEMRSLIAKGRAKNVSEAARQLANRANGLGSFDSIVERLRRAYGRKYPTRKRS